MQAQSTPERPVQDERPSDDPAERPNIAILVLDSARGDYTPWHRDIDTFGSLASLTDTVSFTDARAHSITSATSMGSLLTGQHPFRHGLEPAESSLPSQVTTVAERLSDVGYRTVGVSANIHFSPHTDLDRGFDRFRHLRCDVRHLVRSVGIRQLVKFGLRLRSESAGFDLTPQKHTVTPLMNSIIREEITPSVDANAPFFLVAQYIEPHSPYYPPRKCLESGDERLADISYRIHDQMYRRQAHGCELSSEEWNALERMYATEIRYTLNEIREIVEHIDRTTSRDTIVVVTADHGDLFGEQDFLFHSRPLHSKLTHVPLVTRALPVKPDAVSGGKYHSPVTHADVVRTVLAVAGSDTSGIDGIDLRKSVRNRYLTQRPYPFDYEILRQHNPEYDNEYVHEDPVSAFTIDQYKIKVSERKMSIFDIDADPSEESPLPPGDLPETVRTEFTEWYADCERAGILTPTAAGSVDMDRATKSHLEDLGYL